jgi:hypothetical protein
MTPPTPDLVTLAMATVWQARAAFSQLMQKPDGRPGAASSAKPRKSVKPMKAAPPAPDPEWPGWQDTAIDMYLIDRH